ncbi:hypothetical protein [Actinomadura rugatobispora]|uniref:PE-PGRS family protein n=1 Tax=Actinomadura rugatobispora TaxID=1994 RepID=A0ABW1A5N3_9ACTN|nr:hypothetical protein GCM10010200_079090 [Actinomadura rugatobispora]
MTEWSPVVYGRTRWVDRWRRAWPAGVPLGGRPEKAMLDVINGGEDLVRPDAGEESHAPRFLLARGADGVLVGVACRARMLSDAMHTDLQGGRELYCFVGWFGAGGSVADLPPLADLAARCQEWAGRVYERFMKPVWELHEDQIVLERTLPEPAPWASTSVKETEGEGGRRLSVQPDVVHVLPADQAAEYWDRAVLTGADFALATGWWTMADRRAEHLTHLCVEGVREPRTIPRPKPEPRTEPVRPKSAGAPKRSDWDRFQHEQVLEEDRGGRGLRGVARDIARAFLGPEEEHHTPHSFGGDAARARKRTDQARGLPERKRQELIAAWHRAKLRYEAALKEAEAAEGELAHIEELLGGAGPGAPSDPHGGGSVRPVRRTEPPPDVELPERPGHTGDFFGDTWGRDR